MKEIKQISFSEMLLVPAKIKFAAQVPLSYLLKDPIKGSNGEGLTTTVYTMLFNCETTQEIPDIIDLEIKNLQKEIESNPDKEVLQSNLEFFSNLKRDILNASLRRNAPDDLLFIFSKTGDPRLKKEDVIFISGVSSLVEV